MSAAAPAVGHVLPAQSFEHFFSDLEGQPARCQVSIYRRQQDSVERITVILSSLVQGQPDRPSDPITGGIAVCCHRVATEIHGRHFPKLSPFYVNWVLCCPVHHVYYLADLDFEVRRGRNFYEDPILTPVDKQDVESLCGGLVEVGR